MFIIRYERIKKSSTKITKKVKIFGFCSSLSKLLLLNSMFSMKKDRLDVLPPPYL